MHLCRMIRNDFSILTQWTGRWLALIGLGTCLVTCQLHSVEQIGALVPPTADQDPALPQLSRYGGRAPARPASSNVR